MQKELDAKSIEALRLFQRIQDAPFAELRLLDGRTKDYELRAGDKHVGVYNYRDILNQYIHIVNRMCEFPVAYRFLGAERLIQRGMAAESALADINALIDRETRRLRELADGALLRANDATGRISQLTADVNVLRAELRKKEGENALMRATWTPPEPAIPAPIPPIMAEPLSLLNLSTRSNNALHNDGILTIGALCELSESFLLRVPNFGRKSLKEVKVALAAHGLTLSSSY